MTAEKEQVGTPDDHVTGRAGRRPRQYAVAAGLAAVVLAAAVVAVVVFGRATGTSAAAPVPPTGTSAPSSAPRSVLSSLPASDRTAVAAQPTVIPGKEKDVPPAMTDAQLTATRAELTALAPQLPSLALTAPATWAQGAADHDQDIVSCPHIADRLAADLGGRWTYSYGKLPSGPGGCYWTPVPWVPDVSRNFVSIGYETGTVAGLMTGMDFCSGGVEAPSIDAPQVGRGAVLYGCDDVSGPGYDVAVPDTGGTGVFFLSSTGGPQSSAAEAVDELLAVIDGATHNYG